MRPPPSPETLHRVRTVQDRLIEEMRAEREAELVAAGMSVREAQQVSAVEAVVEIVTVG